MGHLILLLLGREPHLGDLTDTSAITKMLVVNLTAAVNTVKMKQNAYRTL